MPPPIEDTPLLVIERRQFLPFLRRNEASLLRLLSVRCSRLRRTSTALEEIALFDLPGPRLARVLLKLAEDYGRPGSARYPHPTPQLSQRDLSNLVASAPPADKRRERGSSRGAPAAGAPAWWTWRTASSYCAAPSELKWLTDVR